MEDQKISNILIMKLIVIILILLVIPIVSLSIIQPNVETEIQNWPTVQGLIIESELIYEPGAQNPETGITSEAYYKPRIVYEYTVDNKLILSSSISIQILRFNSRNEGDQFLSNYAIDTEVLVYYNPYNPQISFIHIETEDGGRILNYIPIIFACVSTLIIFIPNYRLLKKELKFVLHGRKYSSQLYKLNLSVDDKKQVSRGMISSLVYRLLSEGEKEVFKRYTATISAKGLIGFIVISQVAFILYILRSQVNLFIIFFEIEWLFSVFHIDYLILFLLISGIFLFFGFHHLLMKTYPELNKDILSLKFGVFIVALILGNLVIGLLTIMFTVSFENIFRDFSNQIANSELAIINGLSSFNTKFIFVVLLLFLHASLTFQYLTKSQSNNLRVKYVKYILLYPTLVVVYLLGYLAIATFILIIIYVILSLLFLLACLIYVIPYISYLAAFFTPPVNIVAKYMLLVPFVLATILVIVNFRRIYYYRQIGVFVVKYRTRTKSSESL